MDDLIGLFDMDGTLFDYEGQLRIDMRRLMASCEEEPDDLFDESKPYLKARMDLIKSQPGWWRDLPKLDLGWQIYRLAEGMGFDCHIYTKGPHRKRRAWMEKAECIDKHFDGKVFIDIAGKDKSARYGRFLCDDYPPYLEGWLKHRPRGLGIMIANERNKEFKHPNVVRYDGSNLSQVERLLEAVKNRKPGEHWMK